MPTCMTRLFGLLWVWVLSLEPAPIRLKPAKFTDGNFFRISVVCGKSVSNLRTEAIHFFRLTRSKSGTGLRFRFFASVSCRYRLHMNHSPERTFLWYADHECHSKDSLSSTSSKIAGTKSTRALSSSNSDREKKARGSAATTASDLLADFLTDLLTNLFTVRFFHSACHV